MSTQITQGPLPGPVNSLTGLPYDLIRMLCALLPSRDISSLLSTCHNLHLLYDDEAIWRELCARYGVTDPLSLGDPSFRTAYAAILHTYGPLLGLWASDHPYKGSIIEFRVDAELKGIVGEVWRFWPRRAPQFEIGGADMQQPNPPEYYRFMHISLAHPQDQNHGEARRGAEAVLHWYVPDAGEQWYYGPGTASVRVPTLHVVPPSDQAIVVRWPTRGPTHEVTLPAFPTWFPSSGSGDAWYDSAHELPRLRPHDQPLQPVHMRFYLDAHHPHIVTLPSAMQSPPALMIRPPPHRGEHYARDARDPFAPHEPRLPLDDMRNVRYPITDVGWFYRRFYPLRSFVKEGQDPASNDWSPESLEGLWLGAYGPHGTELLFLEHDDHAKKLHAWKVTGDMNVPRGVCSWTVDLNTPMNASDLPSPNSFGTTPRFYQGLGVVSSTGYL